MTAAVATADLDYLRDSDADLVHDILAGDRTAFAQIYDRYADRLHDFCLRMLRDRDGAADCVQETFCVAATRLHQLREPDKLRPWLYAIARTEALARLRERRRETLADELPDVESHDPTPDTLAARTELADLIAKAASGLSDRDRVVFDLAFQHGLSGPELADALEISHANANKIVLRLRRTVERSLGALLLSRRARSAPGGCAELGEILTGWDGQLTVLMRKRISRHVESCRSCDNEQRRMVNPEALLASTPIFIAAPDELRDRTLDEVQLTCHGSGIDGGADWPGPSFGGEVEPTSTADDAGPRRRARRWLWAAVLLLLVLGASAGLTFAWDPDPITILPTEITEIGPELGVHPPAPGDLRPTPAILPAPVIAATPLPKPPPQEPVTHTVVQKAPEQVLVPTLVPVMPKPNALPPPETVYADKQATASQAETDVRRPRRFPAAQRDRDSAPKVSASSSSAAQGSAAAQGSSAAQGPSPSEPRTSLRTAPAPDSDPEPNAPVARQSSRGAAAADADPPARRSTGRR